MDLPRLSRMGVGWIRGMARWHDPASPEVTPGGMVRISGLFLAQYRTTTIVPPLPPAPPVQSLSSRVSTLPGPSFPLAAPLPSLSTCYSTLLDSLTASHRFIFQLSWLFRLKTNFMSRFVAAWQLRTRTIGCQRIPIDAAACHRRC